MNLWRYICAMTKCALTNEVGAAGTWKIYWKAKQYLGDGTIRLGVGGGVSVFKMCLHRASAATALLLSTGNSSWNQIPGEISAKGGYAVGGCNLNAAVPQGTWTVGAGTPTGSQYKFSYASAGLVFTANGATLHDIRFAVIRNSTATNNGKLLCFCTLSINPFSITSPNTLTVLPASTGVFTLT
jgi:hypothetical protein